MKWHRSASVEELQRVSQNTAATNAGVRFTSIGEDWVEATLNLDEHTKDAEGNFHPGAFSILAETVGSIAASLCIDPALFVCVGQSIELHHFKRVNTSPIRGRATGVALNPLNHVWKIEIFDAQGALVCLANLTMAVVSAKDFTVGRDSIAENRLAAP